MEAHSEEYKRKRSRYDELLVSGKKPMEAYAIAFAELKNDISTIEKDMNSTFHRTIHSENQASV